MSNLDFHPSFIDIPSKTIKESQWASEVEKFLSEGGVIEMLKPGETKLNGYIPTKSAHERNLDYEAFRGEQSPQSRRVHQANKSAEWNEAVNFPTKKRQKIITEAYNSGKRTVRLPCRHHGWSDFGIYNRNGELKATCRVCKRLSVKNQKRK